MSQSKFLALLWTAALLVACLFPLKATKRSEPRSTHHRLTLKDKVAHFILFAGFGALWLGSETTRRRWMMVLSAGIVLAVGTEVLQGLPFINRDPDPLDALADLAGLLTVCAMHPLVVRSRMTAQVDAGDSLTGTFRMRRFPPTWTRGSEGDSQYQALPLPKERHGNPFSPIKNEGAAQLNQSRVGVRNE